MDSHNLENILFEKLGYANSPGLLREGNIAWPSGRHIPEVNAVLQIEHIPVAYFSRFTELDLDAIQQLHRKVWSQSKAPLLFVTLPHEIRVYSGYEPTPQPNEALDTQNRLLQKLEGLTDVLTIEHEINNKLLANKYERIYLETGAFWNTTEGRRVKAERRADSLLVRNMQQMRNLLTAEGISPHLAYTLLGRSIFIRYLEDRGVLTPDWIEEITAGKASAYRTVLPNRNMAYVFFEALSKRFNGDLFPVEPEESKVEEPHLELLLSFLNRTDLETGQLSLWPYNFEYIPIELISNIYDTFIDNRRASGAYYTPLLLADFILEETLGGDIVRPNMSVLDPACGSGIFLVGAYRRLVQAWRNTHDVPNARALSQILQRSIFGVDKKREAVRIAAFSLYLEMLNHLSNAQIQDSSFKFPSLTQHNLLHGDFFEQRLKEKLDGRTFDRVIGNMPWGRGTLSAPAQQWLDEKGYTVGGKQAAPAFMLRVPEFCKQDGEIALLAPVKSTILVTSDTHQTFRKDFFTRYDVRAVVNFAAMRHELFSGAVNPAAAMFYTPNLPVPNRRLIYSVPKPSPLSQRLKAIVLDTTEIKFLDLEALLDQPQLWKVAMWGGPRDAALISQLKALPTLREQAEKLNWIIGEGIQINGGDENPAAWLEGMNLVPTTKLRPYLIDLSVCKSIKEKNFHRPRVPELVQAPLVLLRQSQCYASYSDKDVAYRHQISGIAGHLGQEWLMKWLVAYINSPLAKYYHFLTSTLWAIERGIMLQWEYEEMPFLIPDENNPRLRQVLYHFEKIAKLLDQEESIFATEHQEQLEKHKAAINQLVFELYGLHPTEQQLVQDMLDYGVEFFNWAKRKSRKPQGAKPVQSPDVDMLKAYAQIFSKVASSILRIKNKTLNTTIYQNGEPLTAVSFDLVDIKDAQPMRIIHEPSEMRTKLYQLNDLLLAQETPSMFMRRHARVYDGDQVSLVRPSEQRFWTQSQARADADAFIAELFT